MSKKKGTQMERATCILRQNSNVATGYRISNVTTRILKDIKYVRNNPIHITAYLNNYLTQKPPISKTTPKTARPKNHQPDPKTTQPK